MTRRHLGQNFLYDPSILTRIVQVAQLSRDDLVVEIGPGHGRLTKLIAENVKKIISGEIYEFNRRALHQQNPDFVPVEFLRAIYVYLIKIHFF